MPAKAKGRIQKYLLKRKYKRSEVVRILAAIMEKQATAADGERSNDYHNEFYNTGRIGRRNALPDILGCNCTTTTADLPSRLSGLTTKDTQASTSSAASTSSSGAGPSTSAAAILDRDQPSTSQSCTQNTLQQSSDDDMNQT